jgi:hypothetical protein
MANAVDGAGSANNCQHRRKSSVEDDLYPVHSTFYRRLRHGMWRAYYERRIVQFS